jgi:succinylglutamate desuccinylase
MDSLGFRILDYIPDGLLDVASSGLQELLGGPTLIHLDGARKDSLFLSVMLHGNEYTGLLAMQQILRRYQQQELPRSLSIFIGNVAAAEQNLRALPGQPDYNRIWGYGDTPEHQMTHRVMQDMMERQVFAAIDVHNNTGKNPHFALICRHGNSYYRLATLFNRTVVYTVKPDTTSTWGMSEYCPSVTLECGLPGDEFGVKHAVEFIEACLHLSHFPEHELPEQDMDLYQLTSIVKIPSRYTFSFIDTTDVEVGENVDSDITFDKDLSCLNFSEIASGEIFCRIKEGSDAYLEAWDEHGKDQSSEFFIRDGSNYRFRLSVMPAMLTDNKSVIRMDCLCYLMKRIKWGPLLQGSAVNNEEREPLNEISEVQSS